jgi:hypothetical protein
MQRCYRVRCSSTSVASKYRLVSRAPFRRFFDGNSVLRNEMHHQPREILQRGHNRTLEVRGSIPRWSSTNRRPRGRARTTA